MLSEMSPKECKLVRFVIRLFTSWEVSYVERASLSALPSCEEKLLVTGLITYKQSGQAIGKSNKSKVGQVETQILFSPSCLFDLFMAIGDPFSGKVTKLEEEEEK